MRVPGSGCDLAVTGKQSTVDFRYRHGLGLDPVSALKEDEIDELSDQKPIRQIY
jgi:hypothetical protein